MKVQGLTAVLLATLLSSAVAAPECSADGSSGDECDASGLLQSRVAVRTVEAKEAEAAKDAAESVMSYEDAVGLLDNEFEKASDPHTNDKGYEVVTEVKATCSPCDTACEEKQLSAAFVLCDTDSDGKLSTDEVHNCMFDGDVIDQGYEKQPDHKVNCNATDAVISTANAQEFIKDTDEDGDGELTARELLTSRQPECGSSLIEGEEVLEETRSVAKCISKTAKKIKKTWKAKCSRTVNVKNCWSSWEFWKGSFWTCRWKTITETYTCIKNKIVKTFKSIGAGFKDCWQNILDYFSDERGFFMKLIKNCNSVSNCANYVKKGIKALADLVVTEIKRGVTKTIESGPLGKGFKIAKNIVEKTPQVARDVGAVGVDFGKTLIKFVSGSGKRINQYMNKIDMCTSKGYGFWKFEPTDCGAFAEMKKIFQVKNILKIGTHFKNTMAKFGKCLIKTSIMSLPTPFNDVKIVSFCVPNFLQIPIKAIVGTFQYVMKQIAAGASGCNGANAKEPVCELAKDIEQVGKKLADAFRTDSLLEKTSAVVGDKLHGNSSHYYNGGDCSGSDFKVFIKVGASVTFPRPPTSDERGIGLTLAMGCRYKKFFCDVIFTLSQGAFIAGWDFDKKKSALPTDISAGISVTVGFTIGTPGDGKKVTSFAAGFSLSAAVSIATAAKKIQGTFGIGFDVLPQLTYPKGFSVTPKVKSKTGPGLLQTQSDVDAAVAKAETDEERVYAATGVLAKHLQALHVGKYFESEEYMSAMEGGAKAMAGESLDKAIAQVAGAWPQLDKVALSASLAVNFCLNCGIRAEEEAAAAKAGANRAAAQKKVGAGVGASASQPLKNKGGSGCTSSKKCNVCEGDCDRDSDCMSGFKCFQRNKHERIPGCHVGGSGDKSGYDYCYSPPEPALVNKGGSGCTGSKKCDACKGDCDRDSDCETGLKCFQRNKYETPPGCAKGGSGDKKGYDYCYKPTDKLMNLGGSGCTKSKKCPACRGDCDSDNDCSPGLQCFQRNKHEQVPGCAKGGSGDKKGYDYCFEPPAHTLQNLGGSGCTKSKKCFACAGDCDSDKDCQSGLKCYQRNSHQSVPGCQGGGSGDKKGYDYCYKDTSRRRTRRRRR